METLTELVACRALEDLARQVPPDQAVVEVGVHQGGSLRFLAAGARGPLYGIDTWGMKEAYGGRPERGRRARYTPANQRIAQRLVPTAVLIRNLGTAVAASWDREPVGGLFIDAEHRYGAVMADLRSWLPHLAPGAWVAFDDCDTRFLGVQQAVAELTAEDGPLVMERMVGNRLAVTRLR